MNLLKLNNLIYYVNLMFYANFLCFLYQIPYHFSHSINDYSGILYFHYILQITSYVYDSCFISQYHFISFYMFHVCILKKKKKGYEKELYVPEGTITVRDSDIYLCFIVLPKQGSCHQPKQGQLYLYGAATISLIGMPIYPCTWS